LGGIDIKHFKEYYLKFKTGDWCSLYEDGRKHNNDAFWDIYPDIEQDAKSFAFENCRKTTSEFKG